MEHSKAKNDLCIVKIMMVLGTLYLFKVLFLASASCHPSRPSPLSLGRGGGLCSRESNAALGVPVTSNGHLAPLSHGDPIWEMGLIRAVDMY